MSTRKIFNDPIYGLVSFPFDSLYTLIEHPYFQRLRRISQMGLSNYVYPSANHSRFSHALGALYLMTTVIHSLREKGVDINDQEYEAVCQAILLHDIGHGPFSHGLEELIYPRHHEDISLEIMEALNKEMGGQLDLAIRIFRKEYKRPFLQQLVSSQLDMDRLDYLIRDSFHTGVAEGVIGYKRLISMMNVVDDELVVEEKALFSIEKFIVARHIMYWQVYLHKTSIVAERMLKEFVRRLVELVEEEDNVEVASQTADTALVRFFKRRINGTINDTNYLEEFTRLDDVDVLTTIKATVNHPDYILRYLSKHILNRHLHKLILKDSAINSDLIAEKRQNLKAQLLKEGKHPENIDQIVSRLIYIGTESNQAYNQTKETIQVLRKNGDVLPISAVLDNLINVRKITKYYLCYPR